MHYAIGIDEVGRGPLAGPVTVGAVLWRSDTPPADILVGIRDSKKLSPKKRQVWTDRARRLGDMIQVAVCSVDAEVIDTIGIVPSLSRAANRALTEICPSDTSVHVYADYGLPVPSGYQSTHLVKGDERHPLIALASIFAKVDRDAQMVALADQFHRYGFERNKGYGTAEHRAALQEYGACRAHRLTFLSRLLEFA